MPDIEDSLEQERKEFNFFLDFELGKTHQTLFEVGKTYGSAFLTYIFLITFTAVLVFAKGVDGKVSVPLLGLQLEKDWAAGATLILSNISLLWLFSTYTYSQMLEYKFGGLLNKRYSIEDNSTYRIHLMLSGNKPLLWHYLYPSLPLTVASALLILPNFLRQFSILILAILILAGIYGLPVYLAWLINASTFFWVTIATLVPVLISQLISTIFLPMNIKKLDYLQPDNKFLKLRLKKAGEITQPKE